MRGYKRYQRWLSRCQQEKAEALQKATYWTWTLSHNRIFQTILPTEIFTLNTTKLLFAFGLNALVNSSDT